MLWGLVVVATASLRYHRNDRGESYVERGSERLKLSTKGRAAVRFLAVVGAVNSLFLAYDVARMWTSLQVDATTEQPDYLLNDVCGDGTPVECPGPGVPIQIPGRAQADQPGHE